MSGEADALLDAQIVVDDWIAQNNVSGLRVIDEDIVFPPSLHLLSSKRKKILQIILQKGLDSIKASDICVACEDFPKNLPSTRSPKQCMAASGKSSRFFLRCAGLSDLLLLLPRFW